jgi:hypothetical protein
MRMTADMKVRMPDDFSSSGKHTFREAKIKRETPFN